MNLLGQRTQTQDDTTQGTQDDTNQGTTQDTLILTGTTTQESTRSQESTHSPIIIPTPSVFNDATAKVTAFMSAKELHKASIQKPKILVAMAQGLTDAAGKEIADYENDEPFKSFFNKKMIKPSNAILWDEVERRKLMRNIQGRKTGKQWKTNRYLSWLRENPLLNTDDIAYVKENIGVLKNCIILAEAEKKNDTGTAGGKGPSFRGTTAHLRLIEAVIGAEDSRMAYLNDIHSLKRHELDARHNPLSARPNPWQLASQYYNNPDFKPVSTAYPDLHSALAVEIDCSWDAVQHLGPISPEKAKDKFSKMRVETNVVLNKWNRSGNGEGSTPRPDECTDEYDPDDHLGGSSEDRANFLGNSGPHILYLWQKSDDFGILNQVVQITSLTESRQVFTRKRNRKTTQQLTLMMSGKPFSLKCTITSARRIQTLRFSTLRTCGRHLATFKKDCMKLKTSTMT